MKSSEFGRNLRIALWLIGLVGASQTAHATGQERCTGRGCIDSPSQCRLVGTVIQSPNGCTLKKDKSTNDKVFFRKGDYTGARTCQPSSVHVLAMPPSDPSAICTMAMTQWCQISKREYENFRKCNAGGGGRRSGR